MIVEYVVLGDKSKFSALKGLFDDNTFRRIRDVQGKKNIVVNSIGTCQHERTCDDSEEFVFSESVCSYCQIKFPRQSDFDVENFSLMAEFLIFEEFPFCKDSTKKLISKCIHRNVRVILFDIPRTFLETDISSYGDNLCEAKETYCRMVGKENLFVVKPNDGFSYLLKNSDVKCLRISSEKKELICEDVHSFWNDEYQYRYEADCSCKIENPSVLDCLTKFSPAMQEDISKKIKNRAIDYFLKDHFDEYFAFAVNLYMEKISSVLVWDSKAEKKFVENAIKKDFESNFSKMQVLMFNGTTLEEFEKFKNDKKLDISGLKGNVLNYFKPNEKTFESKLGSFLKNLILERMKLLTGNEK